MYEAAHMATSGPALGTGAGVSKILKDTLLGELAQAPIVSVTQNE
jgi:hypothetical protein